MKFKEGDIVMCKTDIPEYNVTKPGVKCEVIETLLHPQYIRDIKVEVIKTKNTYWVESRHFKLVKVKVNNWKKIINGGK